MNTFWYIGGILTGLLQRSLWTLIKYIYRKVMQHIRKRRGQNQERENDLEEGGVDQLRREFAQRKNRLELVERNWFKRNLKIALGKIGHRIMNLGYPPKLRHFPTPGEVALAEQQARLSNNNNSDDDEETSFITNPNHHMYETISDPQPQPSTSGFKPATQTTNTTTSTPSPSSSSQTYLNPIYLSPQTDSTSSPTTTPTPNPSGKGKGIGKKTPIFRKRPENSSTLRKSSRPSKPPKKYDPSDPSCGVV